MVLTEKQGDAIAELINIAFARTASSLSEMSGYRVFLDAPAVEVQPIHDLPQAMELMVGDEVATVHQIFSGPVAGDALLILNYDGAILLADLLCAKNETSHLDPFRPGSSYRGRKHPFECMPRNVREHA